MKVLILKNHPLEGPGTLESFLKRNALSYTIVEVSMGEKIPDLNDYEYLVVLGGPMGVYEAEKYFFLKEVSKTMESALKKGMKLLGICLGAQLFAHVLGAKVYRGEVKEIGWCEIEATSEGLKDNIFSSILDPSGKATVFQWHGDTYELPAGAIRLASSKLFKEQAFKYENSYALQFHIEITFEMLNEWIADSEDLRHLLDFNRELYQRYNQKADLFFRSFFKKP